jgi:signal transduction histidine kinase
VAAYRLKLALAGVGVAGLVAEGAALVNGVDVPSAALDLAAGWALLIAAVATKASSRARMMLLAVAGGLWFVGTPTVVGGGVGDVAAWGASLYCAPLAAALLARPKAWPARRIDRGVVLLAGVRGVIPALAASDTVSVAFGLLLGRSGIGQRSDREDLPRRALSAFGIALAAAAGLRRAGQGAEAGSLLVATSVVACGVSLTLVERRRRLNASSVAELVVDLGRLPDARSFEGRLGDALADPRLRLLYRFETGAGWLDATGARVPSPETRGDRFVTEVQIDGGGAAALIHARGALEDLGLRTAVLSAIRLAITRLELAAEAAAQLDALAASRGRLGVAATVERDRFAAAVAAGPGELLVEASGELEAAEAPPELAELVRAALDELRSARNDLGASVAGATAAAVAARGLAASLGDLAERAAAECDIQLGRATVPDQIAVAAWYVAAEAVANALKHAQAATITIAVRVAGEELLLEVIDDGVGGADPDGHGLRGVASRLADVGGRLEVASRPGDGTTIAAGLPLRATVSRASLS